MKPMGKSVWVSLCAVAAVLACSLVTPTYARYANVAHSMVTYGNTDLRENMSLSADTEEYDFGVYDGDADRSEFAHTLRITGDAPVEGILRFSWDDTTRANKDMAVYIDSAYYTSVQNSGYADYTVSAADGDLQIPFSVMFSSPSPRVAVLNVSWYPEGEDEPTLFARYRLAVADEDADGDIPAFVAAETAYVNNRLLQVAVTTPAVYAGVQLTPADGVFAAGTRYFSDTCPKGATLLRDSALFVPREGDTARVYVDTKQSVTALRVAASDTLYSDVTMPSTVEAALTVSLSNAAGLLSTTQPLTITLTEGASMRDGNWSHTGDPADLTWQMWRREDGTLHPVAVGEHLAVTAAQNESGGTLTVTTDGKQPAGTYLLLVTQYYQGYPVLKTPIWFFIDYR